MHVLTVHCFIFNLDKIYEARHKLLNLNPKSMVEAEVPATYFSAVDKEFNSSKLVDILSSVPNSPLTPGGLMQNFTPNFPNAAFQNQLTNRVHDFANLTPSNLRFHALQQHALQQQVNSQNLASNLASNVLPPYPSNRPSASPRSTSSNTSGYLSHSSNICRLNMSGSSNSMEQLYAPYKPSVQINGNGISHFPQSENQIFVGSSNSSLSRHLNDSGSHPFEAENRLLTPNYHTVCMHYFFPRFLSFIRHYNRCKVCVKWKNQLSAFFSSFSFCRSQGTWISSGNALRLLRRWNASIWIASKFAHRPMPGPSSVWARRHRLPWNRRLLAVYRSGHKGRNSILTNSQPLV